jgi:hypothetical protein
MKKFTNFLYVLVVLLALPSFGQQNIAPLATITANGAGAAGCQTGACSTLNDLNLGTCGSQQMWISTGGTPSTTPGVDWIQWDFPFPRTFDSLIIHHGQTNARFLTGATVQYWDGSAWVTHSNFSNLPQQCVNRVYIGKLTAARFRITAFLPNPGPAQQSNQNFREIEIIEAPNGPDDAAVFSIDSPYVFCGGVQNIYATIGNRGINQLDSVWVYWEVNGVVQDSIHYQNMLDTVNGSLPNSVKLQLGTYTFGSGLSEIRVYTSRPNGMIDTTTANDTVRKIVGPSMSGNYTIDTSMAQSSTNFHSFGELKSSLEVRGVCAPVTVTVAPAIYYESFNLKAILGASATNTITIDGGNSLTTELSHDGSIDLATVTLNGADYVTMQNLTIRATGTSNGVSTLLTAGADYNTFRNNRHIVNAIATTSLVSNLVISGSTSTLTSNGQASHNTFKDNYVEGGYYGAYFYGVAGGIGSSDNKLINNDFQDQYYYGTLTYYQDSLHVQNNHFDLSSRGNVNADGLYIYYSANSIISANYILAPDYGIYSTASTTGTPLYTRRFLISNNMVVSETDYGIYLYSIDSVDFWHNTIAVYGTTTAAMTLGMSTTYPIDGYDVRNNIFYSENTEAYETFSPVPDTIYDKFDYNIFQTVNGSVLINMQGSTYANLPAYQTSFPQYNIASLQGDPEFEGRTNLHVQGPLANEAGDNSVPVGIDIDGQTRPFGSATTVDIGADEFILPPDDAGISEIINPSGALCPVTTDLIVALKNYGTDTLTSAWVYVLLNNTLDSVFFGGALPSGDTAHINFGPVTFVNGILYDIVTYATEPNRNADIKAKNDTVKWLNIRTGLNGIYTIDPSQSASGTNFTNFNELVTTVNSSGVCGSVIVNVASGTYTTSVYLREIPGANSANTLTIDGGDSSTTIITHDASTNLATVTLDGADWVTFTNLTIQATGTSGVSTLLTGGADHNTFRNNRHLVNTSSTSSLASNLVISGSSTTLTSNGIANYNTFANNYVEGGYYGAYWYGVLNGIGTSYNRLLNNEFTNQYYYGVWAYYTDSLEVIGNEMDLVDRNNVNADGIYCYGNNNMKIVSNYVRAPDYGLYASNSTTSSPLYSRRSEIINNMVISETDYGMYLYSVDSVDIWYNTIVANGTTTAAMTLGMSTAYPIDGYDVRNNIFYSQHTEAYETFSPVPDTIYDKFDYNIFHSVNGSVLINMQGTTFGTLSSYQASFPQYNIASLQGDPEFVSSSDLHVAGPLANDVGDNSVPVSVDIDGESRPKGGSTVVDIGADEFILPPDDAGISEMINPSGSLCPSTSDLIVALKNFGTDTLTSAWVYVSVNNVLDSIFFGGALPTGDTVHINFGPYTYVNNVEYNLIAYSTEPNRNTDIKLKNDTVKWLGVKTGLSGTYTLNPHLPASSTNFTTFDSLTTVVGMHGVCGAVVINVDTGTYLTNVYFNEIPGASSTNTLIIDGGDSSLTSISHNGSGVRATVTLNGTDWVTFKNLTIEATGSNGYSVLFINGADHNTFSNNRHIVNSTSTSSLVTNINFSASETSTSTGGQASNNTIANNYIEGGYYGIFVGGTTGGAGSVGNRFIDNELDKQYYYGMYAYYQDDLEVRGNYIDITGRNNVNADGLYMPYSNNLVVEGNYVYAPDYGIYLLGPSTAMPPYRYRNQMYNNMIISDGDYAAYLYSIDSMQVWHNSFVTYGSTNPGFYLYMSSTYPMNGYDIRNNIFYSENTEAFESSTTVPNTIYDLFDHNLFESTNGTDVINMSGTGYSSLTSFQVAFPQFNGNSIEQDPQFTSATDLHILGINPNSKGDTTVPVNVDIDGDPRPLPGSVFVDLGADEFNPPAVPNVGFVELVSPMTSVDSCYGSAQDVVVKLTNAGGIPLDFTVDTTTLTVNVSGAITQTYSYVLDDNSLNGNQPLGIGLDIVVNLGTINLSTAGTYNFDGLLELDGDYLASDDSLSRTVTVNAVSGGTIAGNDSICSGDSTLLVAEGYQGSLQWQVLTGSTWTDITGETTDSYLVKPTVNTSYRVLACGSISSDTVTVVPITVPVPTITNNIVSVACNAWGTDTLIASSTFPGAGYIWYDDSVGGNEVHRGDTLFYMDSVWAASPSRDTFYVSATSGGAGGDTALPVPHDRVYSGNVRGYHFEAPVDFTITGLEVAIEAGSGNQNVAVLKTVNNVDWNIWSAPIVNFTTLFLAQNASPTGYLPVNIPIKKGEKIAILGQRGTNNSYSSASSIQIDGKTVAVERFIMQNTLATTAPASATQMGYESVATLSRVNFTYSTGCESERVPVIGEVDCLIGVDESTAVLSGISITPNPSNGIFKLMFNQIKSAINVEVRDIDGKLVYEDRLKVNGHLNEELDFTGFAKGVYFLKLQSEDRSTVRKLIVQ